MGKYLLTLPFSFSMQLSWEDWGVLLRPGCGRQKSEFEYPWRVHWGRSVCELLGLHQWHKLRDLPWRLLQAKRGKLLLSRPFAAKLGVQTITAAGQQLTLLKRVWTAILWRLTSKSDSAAAAFHSWKCIKVSAQRNRRVNCVDMKACTWGHSLQLVFQSNLKEDVVL